MLVAPLGEPKEKTDSAKVPLLLLNWPGPIGSLMLPRSPPVFGPALN